MSLRERNKAEKLERIRAAAWALFSEQGYDATSTREICARARIGTGTLFSYVDDKTDLLVLLFVDRFRELSTAAFAELPGTGLADDVEHIFAVFFEFYASDRRLGRQILRAIIVLDGRPLERLGELQVGFQLELAARFQAAIAAGELRADADPYLAAAATFGTYLVTLTALLNGLVPDAAAARGLFRAALDQQVRGLAVEGA